MNKWLKGNGYWCPDCQGTGRGEPRDRIYYEGGGWTQFYDRCRTCSGSKRLPGTPADIIAGTVPETPPPAAHSILSQCLEHGRDA